MINKFTILKVLLSGAIALNLFALSSCRGDASVTEPDATAINQLFDQLDPEMQNYNINPSVENVITGKDGLVIKIPANALIDENGNAPSGSVSVSLKEMLSVKNQILSGVSTVSENKELQSGGEFFFEIRSGGKKLNVTADQAITIDIPSANPDTNMRVFIGNDVDAGKTFDWVLADSTYSEMVTDTIGYSKEDSTYVIKKYTRLDYELYAEASKYVMTIRNLYYTSYFNSDHFFAQGNYVENMHFECIVDQNNEKEAVDFKIALVYKQLGIVMHPKLDGLVSNSANEKLIALLKDQELTIVIIGVGKKSKKTYFGKTTFTVADNSKPSVNITSLSTEALLLALDNL